MERLGPGAIVAAIAILLLLAMVLAWRARKRRQAAFGAPAEAPALEARGAELAAAPVLYVATTLAGKPLERLTIPGLAFRGRGVATVFAGGVSIAIPGEPETFVPAADVRSIGTSTWAIDRVVEPGGLIRLDWIYTTTNPDGSTEQVDVESYLRATALGDATRLIEAVETFAPVTAPDAPPQEGPTS